MLLIRAKENQTINIGEDTQLTVLRIDADTNEVEVCITDITEEGTNTFTIIPGPAVQLLPRVSLMLTRVYIDSAVRAELGFEAPADIRIKGDWYSKPRPLSNETTLRNMTNEELLRYADKFARTVLERELRNRAMALPRLHDCEGVKPSYK